MDIILKLITGETITSEDIVRELADVCEREHSCCNDSCPVYRLSDGEAHLDGTGGCACFGSGRAMLAFLTEKLTK